MSEDQNDRYVGSGVMGTGSVEAWTTSGPGTQAPGNGADDLFDRAVAMWLTLRLCRDRVDEEDAAAITEAMAALDEVARIAELAPTLGAAPPAGGPPSWRDDVAEVEEIVEALYQRFVRDTPKRP